MSDKQNSHEPHNIRNADAVKVVPISVKSEVRELHSSENLVHNIYVETQIDCKQYARDRYYTPNEKRPHNDWE